MEDKLMKLTKLTILCSCFLLLTSLVNGKNKSIDKDKFIRINPNITNEALRTELESLGKEFDIEKQRIRDLYDNKIQTLKDERRTEIKYTKKEFADRREALFTKYGENRKKTKPAINPNMEKREKGKKPLRKAK